MSETAPLPSVCKRPRLLSRCRESDEIAVGGVQWGVSPDGEHAAQAPALANRLQRRGEGLGDANARRLRLAKQHPRLLLDRGVHGCRNLRDSREAERSSCGVEERDPRAEPR